MTHLDMSDAVALFLGGGGGSRLHELTLSRSKLAVPMAATLKQGSSGINNLANSGVPIVYYVTQYQPMSFKNYMEYYWKRDWGNVRRRFIQELQPFQSRSEREDWFLGSARAIRLTQPYWSRTKPTSVIIASGDHLYNMDHEVVLNFLSDTSADFLIATIEIPYEEGKDKGVFRLGSGFKIEEMFEKKLGYPSLPGNPSKCIGSMGIYYAKPEVFEVLNQFPDINDIGSQLIPKLIELGYNVQAYPFDSHNIEALLGYKPFWMDIGTIAAYVEANRLLRESVPPLDIYNRNWSYREELPAKIIDSNGSTHSLIGSSARLNGKYEDCTIGRHVQLDFGASIKEVIAFGIDPWEQSDNTAVPTQIEPGARLERVILDKGIHVPGWVNLDPGNPLGLNVRDGYVIVPKHYEFKK